MTGAGPGPSLLHLRGRFDRIVTFCRVSLKATRPSKIPQNPKTLGDHIKKRRLELGLFQSDVAEIIGVTEPTVTNWEKNRTQPALRALPKIVEFFGNDPIPCDKKNLSETLLKYRKCRGLTQQELANQIGIDPTTLSRMERNRGRSFESIVRKARWILEDVPLRCPGSSK
jgi:transcriptional regulator with XRE-family HTH domain